MLKKMCWAGFLWLLICKAAFALAGDQLPIGTWKTVDDTTGNVRSIVKIWQERGKLKGKIEKIFYRAGEGPSDLCRDCTGERHNQKILGMTILWDLKGSGQRWEDGQIVDPKNGKTYRCNLTLSDDGNQLFVRGYIGISLFGRSQTWYRVKV